MPPLISRALTLIFVLATSAVFSVAEVPATPLKDGDLLALVAGGSLTENIVNEIQFRGLAFHPSNDYLSQLQTAGAGSTLLTALKNANISGSAGSAEDPHHVEFMQHLAQAAGLMRSRRYTDAVRELNAALAANPENAAVGFVMGDLLRQQEQWSAAVSVYREVASRDADFPEVHTKLAFVLCKLGNEDEAISEAKAALKRTPENAEAHKNLGLAWEAERKFDAAISEYQQALRINPDYFPVHYDLGILYAGVRNFDGAIAEYKKAIAFQPGNAQYHNNLANAFKTKVIWMPPSVNTAKPSDWIRTTSMYATIWPAH